MKVKTWGCVVVVSALMAGLFAGPVMGENKAPTEGKGIKAYADDRTVNHWYENHSREAATVVVSDVVKQ